MIPADSIPRQKTKIDFSQIIRRYNMLITLVVMLIFATISTSGSFFSLSNILNVGERASIVGIVALGQTFVTLTGAIDLSVNAIMAVSYTSIALLSAKGVPFEICIPLGLVIGLFFGLINGILVVKTKVSSWLITLGTMMIGSAIALTLSGTQTLRYDGMQKFIDHLFGFSVFSARFFPSIIWILFSLIVVFILGRTRFGLSVFAIGGGARSAFLSGTRTTFVTIMVYVINGGLAALAATVFAYRVGTLNPTSADIFQLQSIAAVVLGGTSLNGGEGSVFGTFFGSIVIAVLFNVLNILQVNSYIQSAILGLLLMFIVFITSGLSDRQKN